MQSTSVVKCGHCFCYGRYLIKLRFSSVTDDGFTSFSSSGGHFMTIFPHEYSLPCWRAILQCRSACLVSVCVLPADSYGRNGVTATICCTIKLVLASTIKGFSLKYLALHDRIMLCHK